MGSRYEIFKGELDTLSNKRYEFETRIEQLENKVLKQQMKIDSLKAIEQRLEYFEKRINFLENTRK